MKHLMTLLALVVAVTAGAQTEWPWNPDSDSDNIIGTVDLLSLLSVFGAEFYIEYPASSESETTVALVKKEGFTDAFGCMSYCSSIGGYIPSAENLSLFGDTLSSLPPPSAGGWNTFKILTKEHQATNHPFMALQRGTSPASWTNNPDGWYDNWTPYHYVPRDDLDNGDWMCFCIGLVQTSVSE